MASHNPPGSGPQKPRGATPSAPVGAPVPGHTSGLANNPNRATIADSGLALAPGARPLPEYELVQLIGQGGFGQVWRARGPGGFSVALKFIKMTEHAGDVELRSLEVMREIRHPHLLGMFGAWQVGGYLVIAMELGDHTAYDYLNAAVKQGWPGVPPDKLMDFMRDAATGIDYLNGLGIQHRDIKPQNLLLVGGSVKVADFGLAKAMAQTNASHTGQQTLAYAAPEFFQGRVASTSDQYSLAVSYCHLRANRLPFQGGMAEMLSGHLMRQPDLSYLPSQAERNVVARALAKDPAHRWPSCREFVQALAATVRPASPPPLPTGQPPPLPTSTQAVQRGHTAPAHGYSQTQPLAHGALDPFPEDAPRRSMLAWVLTGGLMLTLLTAAVVGALLWPWNPEPTVSDTARQQAKVARERAAEHLARREYGKALAEYEEALKHNPKDADALAGRARVRTAQGQYDPALEDCTKALEIDEKCAAAYQARAEAHLARVHLDQARTDADKALELQPGSVDALLTQARVLALLTDFDTALRSSQQAIDRAPNEARVWAERAEVLLAREYYTRAIEDLDRAVEKDPKNPDYLAQRGRVKVVRDGPGSGKEDFEKAVKLWQPTTGRDFAERARLHAELGRYKEALEDCDRAVDREPRDHLAFAVRADVYGAQGDRTRAVTERRNAIERLGEPAYAPGWLTRAQLHRDCGDYEKAIADCGEAVKRAPRFAAAYHERCQLYAAARWDHARALADVDEALRLAPNAPVLHYRRALVLIGLDNPEEAAKTGIEGMTRTGDGDHAVHHARRAHILLLTDQAERAAEAARTALSRGPRHNLALRVRGLALGRQGRIVDGLRDLDQAITQDPTDLDALADRATLYRQAAQPDKALADLEEYQRRSPHAYNAAILLGQHYTAVYRYDDALTAYNRAVTLYPQGAEALLLRGKAHADQSKYHDKARQDFAAVLAIQPNLAAAYAERGLLCLNQGRYDEGVGDFDQALANHKGGARRKAEYLNWQGRCLHESGAYTRAIEIFDRATEADRSLPYPYNNRALSLSSLGQHDKALQELERALQMKTDSALYHANKGYIYYQKRDYPNCIQAYTKALDLEKNPRTRANYLQFRGDAWFDQRDYRRAAQDFRDATQIDPTKAMHFSKLGVALYWADEYDEALVAQNRALQLETLAVNRATFYNRRGYVYASKAEAIKLKDATAARREYERALDDFLQASKANPLPALYHANAGWMYRALQEEDRCVEAYTRAIANEKDAVTKGSHHNYRGLSYYRQKKYQQALEDFKEASRFAPREGVFYANQGDALYYLVKYQAAVDAYNEALKLLTQPKQRASSWWSRGWCYRQLGDKQAAVRDYTSAIELDATRAEFFKDRAAMYEELGQTENARSDRARAAELEKK